MKEIEELQGLIIDWAKEKNLNDPDKQYLKILEEVGETAKAILEGNQEELRDGIGDIAVTIIIYYWQKDLDLQLNLLDTKEVSDDKYQLKKLNMSLNYCNENILYSLYDLATNHNTTLEECLNIAWNEIKDRKGKTVNGTFIKNG